METAIAAGDMALRMDIDDSGRQLWCCSGVYRRTCVVVAMGNAKRKPPRLDSRRLLNNKPVTRNSYLNMDRRLLIFFIFLRTQLSQLFFAIIMTTASRLLCGHSLVPAEMGTVPPTAPAALGSLIKSTPYQHVTIARTTSAPNDPPHKISLAALLLALGKSSHFCPAIVFSQAWSIHFSLRCLLLHSSNFSVPREVTLSNPGLWPPPTATPPTARQWTTARRLRCSRTSTRGAMASLLKSSSTPSRTAD